MMKKTTALALAVFLIAALAGCSGAGKGTKTAAAEPPSETASPSPSPTRSATVVPDVAGMAVIQAERALQALGLSTVIIGKDGKQWTSLLPGPDVKAVSSDPAAGTRTGRKTIQVIVDISEDEQRAAAAAAAEAAKLAVRYEFTCGEEVFHSFKEVWASNFYKSSGTCTVKIDGKYGSEKLALLPSEQALVDIVARNGGDASVPSWTFNSLLKVCAKPEYDYVDQVIAKQAWHTAEARGALALCPDAPHAAVLQEVIAIPKIDDGTKIVGEDMEAGTWKTKPKSKDCYWARTTGAGEIIANDFVGFAPDGVTVTVYPGEGFESSNCGVWSKIG
jgi:hypothetical protein